MATIQTWRRVKLGELGTFRNGVNFGKDKKGEGLGLINVKDLFTDSPYIKFETLDKVDLGTKKGIDNYYVQEGDLFFSRSSVKRDGVGVVSMARQTNNSAVHCGFVIRFRPISSEIHPLYLTYLLRSDYYRQVIIGISGGSAIINISQEVLGTLEVDLPPPPIQRKIAAILSAYDDLIENNMRRIKILEEMARSLYREWFINFRFPGHQQVKMIDSELGLIPEGWEVKKLKDVVELAYGKSLTANKRIAGKVPVYGSAGVVGYHNESLVNGPGVIVGRKGNVGSVFWSDDDFFPIDTVFYVQTEVCLHYIYFNLQNQNFINNDAAVPGLNRNQAYLLNFLFPPIKLLNKFQHFVDGIFKQTKNLSFKNDNLRRTRDLLLPKLISGEIDVENLDINTGNIAA